MREKRLGIIEDPMDFDALNIDDPTDDQWNEMFNKAENSDGKADLDETDVNMTTFLRDRKDSILHLDLNDLPCEYDNTPEKEGATARDPDSPVANFRLANDSSSQCDAKHSEAARRHPLDLSQLQDGRDFSEFADEPQSAAMDKANLIDYGTDDLNDGVPMNENRVWREGEVDASMISAQDRLVSTDRSHYHENLQAANLENLKNELAELCGDLDMFFAKQETDQLQVQHQQSILNFSQIDIDNELESPMM